MSTAKVVEIIGSSEKSWEDAAMNGILDASKTLRNISGVEVISQTAKLDGGKIIRYNTVLKIAFAYEGKE